MNRAINRLKLYRDYFLNRDNVSGLPLELVIEPTNLCNLNCYMCVRQNMKRKIGFMKFSLYRKIIDEASNYLELVYLHGLGEPLFHPEIFKMVAYAKKKGLKVGMSTNATLLDKDKAGKLLDSGLDYLIIAIDAVTEATYKKVRRGKYFNEVTANAKEFLRQKTAKGKGPFTVLQFVKNPFNENEAEGFKRAWTGKGADVVRIKPVIDLLRHDKNKTLPYRPCFYIWRQLNLISWDGKLVTPCCMDAEGDYLLGDANRQTIAEIWNSPRMVALRRAHKKGEKVDIPFCRNCNYPQPSALGRLGAMLVPGMTVKKSLPFLEKLSFGKFNIYD